MSKKIDELKTKLDYFENKREELLAVVNSLKGQKAILDSQKADLVEEMSKLGCKNSTELQEKIKVLQEEVDTFTIDLPDDMLCNLR